MAPWLTQRRLKKSVGPSGPQQAVLPIAIVFFSGWAYLSSYIGEFGVDATEVTVPLPTVLVYAFSPLKSPRVLFFLAISLGGWLASGYFREKECRNQIVLVAALVGLVIFLFVIRDAAQGKARTMAHLVWTGDKAFSVPVLITPHQDEAYDAFEKCRDRRGLRQIIGLPDRMYLLCRDKYYPCERGRMFVVSNAGVIIYPAINFANLKLGRRTVKNRCLFLAVAFAIFPLSDVTAQQATSDVKVIAGVVVVDGPYELVGGGGGVLGYVLSRAGGEANFQPCTGKVKMVDDSDLKRSSSDCKDEPGKDPNSFNVACADVESQVAIVTAQVGQEVSKVDLGTVFLKAANGYAHGVAPPHEAPWVQWNDAFAAPFSVCGQKYVVLPKAGIDQAWIGVIKPSSQ